MADDGEEQGLTFFKTKRIKERLSLSVREESEKEDFKVVKTNNPISSSAAIHGKGSDSKSFDSSSHNTPRRRTRSESLKKQKDEQEKEKESKGETRMKNEEEIENRQVEEAEDFDIPPPPNRKFTINSPIRGHSRFPSFIFNQDLGNYEEDEGGDKIAVIEMDGSDRKPIKYSKSAKAEGLLGLTKHACKVTDCKFVASSKYELMRHIAVKHEGKLPPYLSIFLIFFIKFCFYCSMRMLYPYEIFFAAPMNITSSDYFLVIAIQEVVGFLVIFFESFIELVGCEALILGTSFINSLCLVIFAAYPSYNCFFVTRILSGLMCTHFECGIEIFLSTYVDETFLGTCTGIIEMGWGASSLIGFPLVGYLIQNISWQSPFYILATVSTVFSIFLLLLFAVNRKKVRRQIINNKISPNVTIVEPEAKRPNTLKKSATKTSSKRMNSVRPFFSVITNPNVIITLLHTFFHSACINIVLCNYAFWLNAQFGMSAMDVGLFSFSIGAGESIGALLVIFVADRFKFEFSLALSTCCCTLFYFLLTFLPKIDSNFPYPVVSLIFFFVLFLNDEYATIVSTSRSALIAHDFKDLFATFYFSSVVLGLAVGAYFSSSVYELSGIVSTGYVSSAISAMASLVASIMLFMRLKRANLNKGQLQKGKWRDKENMYIRGINTKEDYEW